MTDELDIHRSAFKEEAHELLAELETSLLEWEDAPEDEELIGRIFRAMHTIKGSGAMFGFDDIAAFTHEVETALDMVRSGRLEASRDLIDLTLAARDQIKIMVDAADGGEPADESRTRALEAAFRDKNLEAHGSEPEDEPLEEGTPAPQEAVRGDEVTYRIRFRPHADVFRHGTNPILLLDELREMGQARVVAQTDHIPGLDAFDPEACYTYWDVILTTGLGIDAIKDVFIFVEDDCDLTIDVIDEEGRFDTESGYKRLGEILIERGDLNAADLEKALVVQRHIGEMLVEAGVVSPDRVQSALLEQQHVREVREQRQRKADVTSIRVPSDRLDKLVDLVGEMVTVQARLSQTAAGQDDPALLAIAEEVERLTAELRDNAMSTRMVPIGTLFSKFRRMVRDLSNELGKEVEMVTEGEETELDKTVIERLGDPLVHLIRNSIDHGIEPPDVRRSSGKPGQGSLRISAVHSGANVLIHIQDDGAGLDPERIRAQAVERGLIAPEAQPSEREIFDLVFSPGFSTAERVTGVSGRGVGMDVVKRNIELLKGTVDVESRRGSGTRITLKLPLTLAIIDGLLVTIGGDHFIIPLAAIEECVELRQEDMERARGRQTVTVRNELVPYVRLRERFGINGGRPDIEQVVIGQINDQRMGFVVDRVIGDHQTVIKSLGPYYRQVTDISGATILGDGSVALILDMPNIVQSAEAAIR
jgi:two-component system chemotaxis sensor kinase CheA